jgi:hypothetical protein
MSAEHAEFFEALRASTAKLLRLDPAALSPSQQVRVDRCASLRLLLDGMQSAQLRGEQIDTRAFISASTELERLLGGDPERPATVFSDGEARAKLKRLIEKTVLADSAVDHERDAERAWRDEQACIAAAGGDVAAAAPPDWKPAPVGGASLVEARDNRAESARQSRAAEPAPPVPQREHGPSNPPDSRNEPWRSHLGPDGSIIAPWFNPHG